MFFTFLTLDCLYLINTIKKFTNYKISTLLAIVFSKY